MQYFVNMKHNSVTLDAFAKVMTVWNRNWLWEDELAWYSLTATCEICFYGLGHSLSIHIFWPTRSHMMVVFATKVKFRETSGYHTAINLMSRVFTNGLEDMRLVQGWIIPKTQKMVLDATLLKTQHYKVRIKGKVEKSRESSSTLPYTSM